MKTLKSLGLPYSKDEIDFLYDELKQKLEDFKTRQLPEGIAFMFIDAYHTQVKDKIKDATLYAILTIDLEGKKDIAGIYSFERENKHTWMNILGDLVRRGLKYVMLIISDDFSGLKEVVKEVYPGADHQLCFIHLQRNSGT